MIDPDVDLIQAENHLVNNLEEEMIEDHEEDKEWMNYHQEEEDH